jgi:predicted RNase H-like nuclease (RuvC/YqgF family)
MAQHLLLYNTRIQYQVPRLSPGPRDITMPDSADAIIAELRQQVGTLHSKLSTSEDRVEELEERVNELEDIVADQAQRRTYIDLEDDVAVGG